MERLERFSQALFTSTSGATLPYRLFTPSALAPGQRCPLVVFLHGAGERGVDNRAQLTAGQPNGALAFAAPEVQAKSPAFVLAPQTATPWVDVPFDHGSYRLSAHPVTPSLAALLELVAALQRALPIDGDALLLTGLSMGGYGAWDALLRQPSLFSAALIVCGAGDPTGAAALRRVHLALFHGELDPVVPVAGSRQMVDALRAVGSDVHYTEYRGAGHNVWDRTYADRHVIDWLLQPRRP